MSHIRIALAAGGGTGPELMTVFQKVIKHLAKMHALSLEFICSPRVYNSYASLLRPNDNMEAVTQETLADASHYRQFCESIARQGIKALFRTSVSAQALYLVRQQLEAVKIEHLVTGHNKAVLLVRDQAQGFYAGTNEYDAGQQRVSRVSFFKKEVFQRIIQCALNRARHLWGPNPVQTVTMVYKFHLFDGLFHSWASEWTAQYGVSFQFVQGDTMNRNLLAFGLRDRELIIASNEYGDIMQTVLLERLGLGAQETNYAENVYLHPTVNGLCEYQTVHGSADDLEGRNAVNPTATIRAAAAMLAHFGNDQKVQMRVDKALRDLHAHGKTTPDQGGVLSTAEFVDELLRNLPNRRITGCRL